MLDKVFPKIHEEGYKFLVIAILITIFLYFVSGFLRINKFGFNSMDVLFF